MISLYDIITELTKEEVRHYKIFTNRIDSQEDRKDVKLFDLIRNKGYKDDDEELLLKLYKDGNSNAYYRLKGRLIKEIEKSLLILYDELDEKIKINNTITLASIYSYKSSYRKAAFLLERAEKSALKFKYYDLLDIIYGKLIEISNRVEFIDPNEIIAKRKENDEFYTVIKQSQYMLSVISYELKKSNFANRKSSVNDMLNTLLAELNVKKEIYDLPEVKYQIYTCVSENLLSLKDFVSLEEYLLKTFNEFSSTNYFNVSNHEQKLMMIGWIINTLFKNKKFTQSLNYAEKLKTELESYNKLLYKKFLFMYHNGLVINYACLNRNKEAIQLLEELKEHPLYKGISFYDMFLFLNLATLYFSEMDYSKAIKNLSRIMQKEIYDSLSPQIQLQVSIVEILLHFEMNNVEYVFHRLSEVKRIFREKLSSEEYEREKKFLTVLSHALKVYDPFKDKKIKKEIEAFIGHKLPVEPGSNEGINYSAWLLSKINQKSYYQNLLELLKN